MEGNEPRVYRQTQRMYVSTRPTLSARAAMGGCETAWKTDRTVRIVASEECAWNETEVATVR